MATLFPVQSFAGFGPTAARPVDYEPQLGRVRGRKAVRLRAGVRESAPKLPGVYGMLGRNGELIYVGKAKSLRARLMSYFRDSRDRKAGKILQHTATLVWETVPDEFGALVRELELIRRHRPRFNVLGVPGHRQYCYVCLGRSPAPYAYVSRNPTGKDLAVFGPLASARRARDAVRRLNDYFRLRDCPQSVKMYFTDQLELFPADRGHKCLRFEIDKCAGPCAGTCSRQGYSRQVNGARRFLEGADDRILTDLTGQMAEASTALQFERAAAFRDRLEPLQWLWERLNWLRTARAENTFVYPTTAAEGRTVWYMIHRGRVSGACFQPTCSATAGTAVELMTEIYGKGPGPGMTPGQVDHVLLVAGWFRRYPQEKLGIMIPNAARAVCDTCA